MTNVRTAQSERADKRDNPQIPCPEVQPLPIAVPIPTQKAAT